jgi:hypothetical protein
MTPPKPTADGPRKGQMRMACFKCGHIEYLPQQGQQPPSQTQNR